MHSDTTGFWTPVALSADLPAQTAMPARLATETIALWRSASGRATASADRCPHRGMRLSHGFVRGEALSCIYHGWSYAQTGQCLKIPAHPGLSPPEAIRVATYPVEEKDGIVWVAKEAPDHRPPGLRELSPLRSVTVLAGIAAIEAAAGAKMGADGLLSPPDAPSNLCLLLSAQGSETLVHVLVGNAAGPSERIAASRAAEALRRQAEAGEKDGAER
jgi:phenylpropionate dioxygenase-like ring-hydroxylating dioxygenase large terminal subunit